MRNLAQNVPANAPAGNYVFHAYLGIQSSGTIYAEDEFNFTKLSVSDGGAEVQGWGEEIACNGSGEDETSLRGSVSDEAICSIGISPNPFNPSTVISFELREASYVSLEIFDVTGCSVGALHATPLQNQYLPAGSQSITFDGSGLSSGIYFVRLQAGEFRQTQKMLLVK